MLRIERASETGFPGATLRGLLILLIGAALWGAARPATAHSSMSPLLTVDIYDRTTGVDARRAFQGWPALRHRNAGTRIRDPPPQQQPANAFSR